MLVRYIENKTFALTEANIVLLLYLTRLRNAVSDIKIEMRPFYLASEGKKAMDNTAFPYWEQFKDLEIPDIKTIHKNMTSEQMTTLGLEDESEGTKRLFKLAKPLLNVLQKGKCSLVIDELDRSLHPVLATALARMFNNPDINKNQAQLIFTTHNTSLLDGEIFRPDQIWFTEKDKSMTKLYSLVEFQPCEDESLQKGYLKGRYGAIPFIGGLNI